jgi:hypothetical protein
VPALGFCIVLEGVLRAAEDSAALLRPLAVTAFTWFCCIVCCRREVSCWNDAGRATLLCTAP